MRLIYEYKPFGLEEFRSALVEAGAEFLDPTNEWEVLRYRLAGKIGIVYRNKKGVVSLVGAASPHHKNLAAGREPTVSKGMAKEMRLARALQLYTDASTYHTTGAASWAAILVDEAGNEHEVSGPLKGEVPSSTAAEARAVANALHHFCKAGLITGDVRVISDSQNVVNRLRSCRATGKCEQTKAALLHIRKIARGRFNVYADWVKGHQPKAAAANDPRVAFNRRCDALAREHSRILHEERKEAARARADVIRASHSEDDDLVKALDTEMNGLPHPSVCATKQEGRPPRRQPAQIAGAETASSKGGNP